jgi:hypothetical protein
MGVVGQEDTNLLGEWMVIAFSSVSLSAKLIAALPVVMVAAWMATGREGRTGAAEASFVLISWA